LADHYDADNHPEPLSQIEETMKKLLIATGILAATATIAFAKPPIFAAQCAGGTNAGGYNVDTDTEGHVWINGHKTTPKKMGTTWVASHDGVEIDITPDAGGLIVSFTGKHGKNGICTITAQ
jgi:hypothetical protein